MSLIRKCIYFGCGWLGVAFFAIGCLLTFERIVTFWNLVGEEFGGMAAMACLSQAIAASAIGVLGLIALVLATLAHSVDEYLGDAIWHQRNNAAEAFRQHEEKILHSVELRKLITEQCQYLSDMASRS